MSLGQFGDGKEYQHVGKNQRRFCCTNDENQMISKTGGHCAFQTLLIESLLLF